LSLIGKILGIPGEVVGDVKDAVGKVKHAVKAAWDFLFHSGGLLDHAWDWMVNGVTWFTGEVSDWAASVYTFGRHLLTKIIPGVFVAAYKAAVGWAAKAIHTVEGIARGLVKGAISWVSHRLSDLWGTVKGWVRNLVKFVTGPVNWVLKTGRHLAYLVLHPEVLAKWIVNALVVPLIMWALKSSANVIVWLVRSLVARDAEIAHVIEEVLAKVI
jgi:hypothetical protein